MLLLQPRDERQVSPGAVSPNKAAKMTDYPWRLALVIVAATAIGLIADVTLRYLAGVVF